MFQEHWVHVTNNVPFDFNTLQNCKAFSILVKIIIYIFKNFILLHPCFTEIPHMPRNPLLWCHESHGCHPVARQHSVYRRRGIRTRHQRKQWWVVVDATISIFYMSKKCSAVSANLIGYWIWWNRMPPCVVSLLWPPGC